MERAFQLAYLGQSHVAPNPMVGAVLVSPKGDVIGEGYHEFYGGPHAEVMCFNSVKESDTNLIRESTLYCTLEPCCHTNKQTPPCSNLVIKKGIKKIIIANLDPHPEVAGKGVAKLEAAGIEVEVGMMEKEGEEMNRHFFTAMRLKRPYIHLKWAQTIDGKLATEKGSSKWITGSQARDYSQKLRSECQAIMVGSQTVLLDNPSLTLRSIETKHLKNPLRLVVSGQQEKKDFVSLKMFAPEYLANTFFVSPNAQISNDPQVIFYDGTLKGMLSALYEKKIYSLFVEGGASLLSWFLAEKMFDEISVFVAPKLLGSGRAIKLPAVDEIAEAHAFDFSSPLVLGDDFLLRGKSSSQK